MQFLIRKTYETLYVCNICHPPLPILIRCSYSYQYAVHKHTQSGLNGQKASNQLGVPKDKYALFLLKFVNAQLSL